MTLASFPAKSFELLMFHDKNCGYCLAFDRDVGFDYNTLEVAKILPLKFFPFSAIKSELEMIFRVSVQIPFDS